MHLDRTLQITSLLLAGFSGAALAHPATSAQICTLASAAAGQPGTLVCKSTLTGATTQSSSADKQQMMKDCMTQVTTANPGVPQKDIQDFCDKEVNKTAPPRN